MKLVGELSTQVRETINQIQKQQDVLLKEIGNIEFRKSMCLEDIKKLQNTIQKLLDQEAKALGIPAGAEWQVSNQDGRVYLKEVGDE